MRQESIDTNVLLRLILRDVPEQYELATKLLQGRRRFHVADLAFVELCYVLEKNYMLSREIIAGAIAVILDDPHINCNRALFDNALPLYAKYPKLSLVDCCLATYAMFNDAEPLWTFDKKMATQLKAAKLVS